MGRQWFRGIALVIGVVFLASCFATTPPPQTTTSGPTLSLTLATPPPATPTPSPTRTPLEATASAEGALTVETPDGAKLDAAAGTFPAATVVSVSATSATPKGLAAADLVAPTIQIQSAVQPAHAVALTITLATVPSTPLFAILWNEATGQAELALVTVSGTTATVSVPHFSSVSLFAVIGNASTWLQSWVAAQWSDFWNLQVQCNAGTSGSPLALRQWSGNNIFDVRVVDNASNNWRPTYQICNQRRAWFTYTATTCDNFMIAYDGQSPPPGGLSGLLPPRTTIPLPCDVSGQSEGAQFEVKVAMTAVAAVLTDAQMIADVLPGIAGTFTAINPQEIYLAFVAQAPGLVSCVKAAALAQSNAQLVGCVLQIDFLGQAVRVLAVLAAQAGLIASASAFLALVTPLLSAFSIAAPLVRYATDTGGMAQGGSISFSFHNTGLPITGRVIDSQTGAGIDQINVQILYLLGSQADVCAHMVNRGLMGPGAELAGYATTTLDGSFSLGPLPAGPYLVMSYFKRTRPARSTMPNALWWDNSRACSGASVLRLSAPTSLTFSY